MNLFNAQNYEYFRERPAARLLAIAVTIPLQVRLRWTLRNNLTTIENLIEVLRNKYEMADNCGSAKLAYIMNVGLFLALTHRDLTLLIPDLMPTTEPHRLNVVARMVVVQLYEATEDLPALLGKELREAVANLPNSDEIHKKIGAASKPVSAFFRNNQATLGKIRNVCAAHRDHDGYYQLSTIDDFQSYEVANMIFEYQDLAMEVAKVLTTILINTAIDNEDHQTTV